MLFERIQNRRGIPVVIPRVKREIDHLFRGIPRIHGVIFCQRLGGRVADRRFPVLLKTQPPVGVGSGGRHRNGGMQPRPRDGADQHGGTAEKRRQNMTPTNDLIHSVSPLRHTLCEKTAKNA